MAHFLGKKPSPLFLKVYLLLALVGSFTLAATDSFPRELSFDNHYLDSHAGSEGHRTLKGYTIDWGAVEMTVPRDTSASWTARSGILRLPPSSLSQGVQFAYTESSLQTTHNSYIPSKKDSILLRLRI